MMFFLGCHLVDLILSIKGKPDRIIPINKCSGVEGVTSEDFGMAVFEYKNGVSFAKTSAVELGGFERRQLVVAGTKKTVELKPLEWYDPVGGGLQYTERYVRESTVWTSATAMERSKSVDRYDSMMRSFGEMVLGLKKNPWDYDYELELYKTVLEACGK
jgi:predicted dehydrogenase